MDDGQMKNNEREVMDGRYIKLARNALQFTKNTSSNLKKQNKNRGKPMAFFSLSLSRRFLSFFLY
jgi:hypothetical protein